MVKANPTQRTKVAQKHTLKYHKRAGR